jgi:outer membrane protein assembly factor BamB
MMVHRSRLLLLGVLGMSTIASAQFTQPASKGDWPMWRRDTRLSGYQPLPGAMVKPPRVLAKHFLGASPGTRTAADLRNTGHADDSLVCARSKVTAFDPAGQQLWISDTPGYDIDRVEWVEDLDGDGHAEVIAGAGHVGGNQQAYVILDASTGRSRGAIDIITGDFGMRGKCGAFLPETKGKQILIARSDMQSENETPRLKGELALWQLEPAGGPKRLWAYVPEEFVWFYPHMLVAPLGPKGEWHAMINSWCHVWNIDLATGKLVNHTTWDTKSASPRQYGWSELIDADGDGHLDYVNVSLTKHVDMLRNVDGRLELAWSHGWMDSVTTEQRALRPMTAPIVDLDGDGKLEVIAGLFDGLGDKRWHLYVWSAAAGEQKAEELDITPLATVSLDAAASKSRVMICARSKTVQFDPPDALEAWKFADGKLTKLWEHKGARLRQTPVADNMRLSASDTAMKVGWPVTPDVDGDGKSEFITTDVDGGRERSWGEDASGAIVEKPAPLPAVTPTQPSLKLPDLAGATMPYFLAADVDGDGRNELLLYDNTNVAITNIDGDALRVKEKIPSTEIPIVCDLLGDGKPVMLTAGRVTSGDLYVRARKADGSQLWEYVFPDSAGCGQYSDRPHFFTVGHFTGGKQLDVFTYSMKPQSRGYVLDGRTGQPVFRQNEVPGIERHFNAMGGRASVYDFNKDGKEDMLFINPDFYCVADGSTGNMLAGPVALQPLLGWWAAYASPALLEPAGGGTPFVYLGGAYSSRAAISLDGKQKLFKEWLATERWPLLIDGQRFAEGLLPPTKSHPTWRAAHIEADGTLRLFEAMTGKHLWELKVATSGCAMVSGDVDGDGEGEIVFGGRDGTLYCIGDGGTAPRIVWKLPLGAPIVSVLLADVDNDGKSEIIASVGDGFVYVLDEEPAEAQHAK